MGEIVNLRRARKAKARQEAEEQAARNRALHGRDRKAKAEDAAAAEERRRALSALERQRIPPPEEG
jgi:hypothetical protein